MTNSATSWRPFSDQSGQFSRRSVDDQSQKISVGDQLGDGLPKGAHFADFESFLVSGFRGRDDDDDVADDRRVAPEADLGRQHVRRPVDRRIVRTTQLVGVVGREEIRGRDVRRNRRRWKR